MRLKRWTDMSLSCIACGDFDIGRIEIVFSDSGHAPIYICDQDLNKLQRLLEKHAPESHNGGVWP